MKYTDLSSQDRPKIQNPRPKIHEPGHPRRAGLRQLLQDLGAASLRITFESHRGQYRLLSYRTEPTRHRLAGEGTHELKAFAMAQIRQALPRAGDPCGKRGQFSWDLHQDRVELRY